MKAVSILMGYGERPARLYLKLPVYQRVIEAVEAVSVPPVIRENDEMATAFPAVAIHV